jgi:hypothetical protein
MDLVTQNSCPRQTQELPPQTEKGLKKKKRKKRKKRKRKKARRAKKEVVPVLLGLAL